MMQITHRLQIFLALLGLIVLFVGCKKDDEWGPCDSTTHEVPVDPILRNYFYGDSSQWIYLRTSDSIFDTVTLQGITRSFILHDDPGGTANMTGGCTSRYNEEQFILFYSSSLTGGFMESTHFDEIYRSGDPGGLAFWGGQVGQSKSGAVIEAIHDSLWIGPNAFRNVTQIYTQVGEPGESAVLRLYFCPNTGIVRKEVMWGDSLKKRYDLVAWQVQPYP